MWNFKWLCCYSQGGFSHVESIHLLRGSEMMEGGIKGMGRWKKHMGGVMQ